MRRDTINYFTVGVFVLVLFLAFLVMLYQITGRTGPTESYFVTYNNVEGIKYGTPVLYEGYQIGQVDSVEPQREGGGTAFRITLAVTRGWSIPSDSIAAVVKSGLLSAVAIDIQEGQSPSSLTPGADIQGREATDIFSAVNDVAGDLKSLTRESLRPLLDNLNKHVDVVGGDLHSLAQDDLKPMMKKLNQTADQLGQLLGDENLDNVNRILGNLQTASASLDELLGRIEATRTNLDKLLTDVNSVVDANDEDVRTVVTDLKKSLYTVSQHIEAVSHHLEGSTRNMQEFTRQIRENPGLLLRGSPQPEDAKSP